MLSLGLILYIFFHICICVLLFSTDTPESTEDWIKLIFWEINVIFTIIYVLFALLLWFFKKGLVKFFKAIWNLIKEIPESFKSIWDEINNNE
jgi:uncharacterized BrkB/YihY/UPF0761 family membrane protein